MRFLFNEKKIKFIFFRLKYFFGKKKIIIIGKPKTIKRTTTLDEHFKSHNLNKLKILGWEKEKKLVNHCL